MERTIQDTFNDKIFKEFGSVPSMQNLYKVTKLHYADKTKLVMSMAPMYPYDCSAPSSHGAN